MPSCMCVCMCVCVVMVFWTFPQALWHLNLLNSQHFLLQKKSFWESIKNIANVRVTSTTFLILQQFALAPDTCSQTNKLGLHFPLNPLKHNFKSLTWSRTKYTNHIQLPIPTTTTKKILSFRQDLVTNYI